MRNILPAGPVGILKQGFKDAIGSYAGAVSKTVSSLGLHVLGVLAFIPLAPLLGLAEEEQAQALAMSEFLTWFAYIAIPTALIFAVRVAWYTWLAPFKLLEEEIQRQRREAIEAEGKIAGMKAIMESATEDARLWGDKFAKQADVYEAQVLPEIQALQSEMQNLERKFSQALDRINQTQVSFEREKGEK